MDNLKYIRYSRKSSESKEKQVASIGDQIKECERIENDLKLQVNYKLQEEKSAFKPDLREQFNIMIDLIKSGKANAILTWKPDRLCRNPKEGGILLQLLQDGILKEIRTPLGDVYTPESDHLILQIHFGMANQFSRTLSQNVRRGLYRKAVDRKEYPRPAPIGYEGFGERGQRNIKPNEIYAPLIRRAFELASIGIYSLGKISEILYEEGLRTKRGNRVTKSHIDIILRNPVYYGYFTLKQEIFEGTHEAIITKGMFDLVQEKLKDRSKPKNIAWEREFVGLMRCGSCSCAITTTVKKKFIKKTREWKNFVYHHCTHRKGNCLEKPLTDEELKALLYKQIFQIEIDKEVWQLGLELIKAKYKDELKKNDTHFQYIQIQQKNLRDKINRLVEMRSNEELTKEEFLEQKKRLLDQLAALDNKYQDNQTSMKTWLELIEDFLDTAFQVREVLINGKGEQKQKILRKIGENFLLKDKMLTFSFKQPYDVLLKPEVRTDVLPDMDSNHDERIQSPLSYR